MVDPWLEKALQMQRETECFSNVTILKAALWLEKKHAEAPDYDTAAIISLHYLILALRKKETGRPVLREHYISQAFNVEAGSIDLRAGCRRFPRNQSARPGGLTLLKNLLR